ncbi:MAG TPA: GNAT family N-acetyltransferase [bacterium]|nr:GNAT family N-acetyltransferase [bacterium]
MIGQTERLESLPALERITGEWEELLRARGDGVRGPFNSPSWLVGWWRHLGANATLRALAVREQGRLVGLAPFYERAAGPTRIPPSRCLELLGAGEIGSDYVDLLAASGDEEAVVSRVADELESRPLPLSFNRVLRGSLVEALGIELAVRGWDVSSLPGERCPGADLPGNGEAWLASLGAEHRYAFRRKLRRLQSRFALELRRAATEEERASSLETLFDLHERRWRSRGLAGAFAPPAVRAFHHEFTRDALARGWLRLHVLLLDGSPVAALYGLVWGNGFYFYQSGFDPAFAGYGVGLVTMGLALKAAADEGLAELDLLHGEEEYKRHWARSARQLMRLEAFPPGLAGWIAREGNDVSRRARRVVRSWVGGAT